jgi:hypothetical protein
MAGTPGKQEDTQRDPQADPRAGSQKANSQVFHQAPKNKSQGIVDGQGPLQAEEMAICLCAMWDKQP